MAGGRCLARRHKPPCLRYIYDCGRWPLTIPAQMSVSVLKGDSRDSEWWVCWACYEASEPGTPPLHPSFKTSEQQCTHLWMTHSTQNHCDWATKAAEVNITLHDLVIAVIGKDLKTDPLASGQPPSKLAKCFPSHPKGHSKLIFREPRSRKLADPCTQVSKDCPGKLQWLNSNLCRLS